MSKNNVIKDEHNIVLIAIKILAEGNQTFYNMCGTGFILKKSDQQFIGSCAHVYNSIPEYQRNSIICFVVSPDTSLKPIKKYNFYDIKFLRQHSDSRADTCLFEFKDKNKDIQNYGYEIDLLCDEDKIKNLPILDEVRFSGYPLAGEFLKRGMGVTLAASKTIISCIKYSNIDNKIDFILIDKLVNPGSSGSPVFCGDQIIGMASASIDKTHRIGETMINIPVNIGLVRGSNYILELLNQ